jgi:hypothetical protein
VNYFIVAWPVMAAHVEDKQLCSLHTALPEHWSSWYYLPVEMFLKLSNFTISKETHISQ